MLRKLGVILTPTFPRKPTQHRYALRLPLGTEAAALLALWVIRENRMEVYWQTDRAPDSERVAASEVWVFMRTQRAPAHRFQGWYLVRR